MKAIYYPSASSVLWTPANTTTALWLDAADVSTITTVSNAVSQWNDKSGNGRHVSQASAGSRFAYSATGFNNLPALLGNGTSTFLSNSAGITTGTYTGPFTVFYVASRGNAAGGAILTERSTALIGCSMWISGNFLSSDGQNGNSNHQITSETFNKLSTAGGIVAHTHVPLARDILYLNGTQELPTTGTASNITGSAGFRIGTREGSVGNFWNGAICEIIVVLSSMTETLRQQFEGYLAHHWAITGSLPAGHPYKTTPPIV